MWKDCDFWKKEKDFEEANQGMGKKKERPCNFFHNFLFQKEQIQVWAFIKSAHSTMVH